MSEGSIINADIKKDREQHQAKQPAGCVGQQHHEQLDKGGAGKA